MFAGKKSAQIREILINESAWEEMTCLFAPSLDNLAHHHRDNTMALADNLAALLEPALLIITGGIIGTLVVAMYLPIFHLGDAMSGMG